MPLKIETVQRRRKKTSGVAPSPSFPPGFPLSSLYGNSYLVRILDDYNISSLCYTFHHAELKFVAARKGELAFDWSVLK